MGNTEVHHETGTDSKPTLYVVATPIGNLGDVSLRALEVLKSVGAVAAEDTRITARLLNHYGITTRMIALHEHNEKRMTPQLLEHLAAGRSVALVSDAGTPAISDPGALVVAAALSQGYRVVPVPGANAAIAALSAAGLSAQHFLFYGFLPARGAERRRELAALAGHPYALIFYEAPHRVIDCIADLRAAFGDARRIVIARELTKMFESIHACALGEAGAWMEADANRRKGEFVLIIEGQPATASGEDRAQSQRVLEMLLSELPLKQAVALATKITGGKRNELYELALSLKSEQ